MNIFPFAKMRRSRTENYPANWRMNELVRGEKEPNVKASLAKTIPKA